MSVLATARDFPLLVHVAGAMVLVGATLTAASALALARGNARVLRFGYWTLLAVALPAWILMRIGAEWTAEREGFNAEGVDEPTWLVVGYAVAEPGGALLLIALILGGIGVYRLRAGKGTGLLKVTTALTVVLLAAYVVAVWAMSGKPG